MDKEITEKEKEANKELAMRNKLYCLVLNKLELFGTEARKHKRLTRFLWWTSAIVSLLIAIFNNVDFPIKECLSDIVCWLSSETACQLKTKHIASLLAIILPVITAYVVFRSPRKLWINEIQVRNKLNQLKEKIELAYYDNSYKPGFEEKEFREEYFKILQEANVEWADIKQD